MRGAPVAAEFAGFMAGEGCEDFAAVATGFVKSCCGSVLARTALRTGTAGPPGQPMGAVPTWVVAAGLTSAFAGEDWGVKPAFLAAAWASAVG